MRQIIAVLLQTSCCAIALAAPVPASAQVTTTAPDPAVSAALGSSPSSDATAANASAIDQGEIVVTATKTESALSKVPISISAFNQAQLDRQSVRNFADIARLTPGLTLAPSARGNGGASDISIRGISSGAGSATTGVYIDETPVSVRSSGYYDSTNPFPRIFDLERVEVLRGPQGTLFGAGSEGGTVRFITPEPSLTTYSGYGRAELGGTQGGAASYEGGAALGGPIAQDVLGFRVSAYYRRDGGYVDRVDWYDQHQTGSNVNAANTVVLRGALKFAPTDTVTITPSIFYQRVHQNDTSVFWEAYSDKSKSDFVSGNQISAPSTDKFYLPALKASWEVGGVTLISNTSYFHRDFDNTYDSTTLDISSFTGLDTIPPPAALRDVYSAGYVQSHQRIFTQEARIQNDPTNRLNFVIGGYFQRAKQSNSYLVQNTFVDRELSFAIGAPVTIEQIFGQPLYDGKYLLATDADIVDKELAAFGQINFRLTDKLTLSGGARYSHVTYDNGTFSAGPVLSSTGSFSTSHQSANPITPKFSVSYQATPATLFYATAAKGFRPGSTTSPVPNRCLADATALGLGLDAREIKPDTVWSYEAGAKTKLFGNKLYVDGSVYRIDWKNIQSSLTLPNCNVPIVANFGEARSQGFDLALNFRLTEALTLGATVGYADAKYTTATLGGGGAVIRSKGEPLPISPWQVTVSGEYDFAAFGHDNYLRVDYQYASHDDTPLDAAVAAIDLTIPRAPASNNLDLRIGTKFNGLDVSLFGRNVLDQHPEYGRYRDTLTTFNYRGTTVRPISFGVTAAYRY